MSIKLIMFDLDNTLINTSVAEYNTLAEFKDNCKGLEKISVDDFKEKWHKALDYLNDEFYKKKISIETLRNTRVKETYKLYGIEISLEDSKKKFEQYMDIYRKNWRVFEDTFEILDLLNTKYKLALVTNGDPVLQNEKIDGMNLRKYFSKIVISGDYSFAKPDPRIFEVVLNKFKLKPEECIMVGDKYDKDIIGGNSIGIKSIWINRKNIISDYKYQVLNLKEILSLI